MAKRVCLTPGCPTLVTAGRCPTCSSKHEKARGTRQERGYDAEYERQLRTPEYVNATHCGNCEEPFTPENPKTGGHTVALRNGGQGSKVVPHCRRCNYGWLRTGL